MTAARAESVAPGYEYVNRGRTRVRVNPAPVRALFVRGLLVEGARNSETGSVRYTISPAGLDALRAEVST